jgi:uncharacterized pyridoxal phosphate-containing UPF0001 family protein
LDILTLPVPGSTNIIVRGLMTMATEFESKTGEESRWTFRELRELRDALQTIWDPNLSDLSMGMTNDFEPAVVEGATLVRIGSALFEGLAEPPS